MHELHQLARREHTKLDGVELTVSCVGMLAAFSCARHTSLAGSELYKLYLMHVNTFLVVHVSFIRPILMHQVRLSQLHQAEA
jgi:hypothetical protein